MTQLKCTKFIFVHQGFALDLSSKLTSIPRLPGWMIIKDSSFWLYKVYADIREGSL